MSNEIPVVVPARSPDIEVVLVPAVAQLPPAAEQPVLSPEQTQANEAAFVNHAQEEESRQVAGVLGMWTSVLLLHDLAAEHLDRGSEEEDEERKRRVRLGEE